MRILIADDHQLMRDGLRALLEREGLTVVGGAASGREALQLAHELRPDLIVMDISMPDLNGIDATKKLSSDQPETKVLALSMNCDQRYVLAMFAAGAAGYLVKSADSQELVLAVRAIERGQRYVSPSVAWAVVDRVKEPKDEGISHRRTPPPFGALKPLSTREREVLQLIAEGNGSKEIAARLDVAVATVESHRRQIMDKLGLRTIAELTKYAIREGLTSLE
ncbi:MAG TPA: response regulator transcription factor [Polyangiaceae bacterium]|nr:response regulator transcription factor [Polyangiaceae bacterium]